MKLAAPMTALLIAAIVSPALGQQSSREDFQDYCKASQGRWVGNVTWIADWPGLGKKGDTVTGYSDFKIIADGNALWGTFYGGNGAAHVFTVFDAGSKQITETMVFSGGTVQNSIVYKKDDKWLFKTTGSNPDGDKIKGDYTLTISDGGDTHTMTGKTTIGGTPVEDLNDVWRRVSKK